MFVVTKNDQKLACLQSWKNAKNSQVRAHKIYHKLAGPWSRKNAKNSYISSHVKILKTRMSAVMKISSYEKC